MENETTSLTFSVGAFGERGNIRVFPPELEVLHTLNSTSPPQWSASQITLLTLASWITLSHLVLALVILTSSSLRRQPRFVITLNLCLCNLIPSVQAFLALHAALTSDFRCAVVGPLAAMSDFLGTAASLYCVLAFLLEEVLCLVLQPPAFKASASKSLRRSILALILLAPWILVAALTPLVLPVTLGLGTCQVQYREPHLDRPITIASASMTYFLPAFLVLLFSASLAVVVKNKWVTLPEAEQRRSCMSKVKEAQTVIVLVGLVAVVPEAHYFFNRVRDLGVVELSGPQATAMWLRLLKATVLPFFWLFYRDVRRALVCRASRSDLSFQESGVGTASVTGTFRFYSDPSSFQMSSHSPRTRHSTRVRADSVRSVVSGRPQSNVSSDSGGFASQSSDQRSTGRTLSSLEQTRLSIENRPRVLATFQPNSSPQLTPLSRPRCNTSSAADFARAQGLDRPNREARSPSDPGISYNPFLRVSQLGSPSSRNRARPGSALEEARAISESRHLYDSKPPTGPRVSKNRSGLSEQGSPVAHRHSRPTSAVDRSRGASAEGPGQGTRSSSADRMQEAQLRTPRPLSAVSHARNITAFAPNRGPSSLAHASVPNLSCGGRASPAPTRRPGSALDYARAITVDRPLCDEEAPSLGERPPSRAYHRMNSSSLPDVRDVYSVQSQSYSQPALRKDDLLWSSQSQFYEVYI